MTPQEELERIVDLSGMQNVLMMLSMICWERATNLAQHDASRAKEYAKGADAIDGAIIKIYGRL
jgi:hypothetical protein